MGLATEGEEAAMPRGWEGNRRSGIALDMRHRLQRFIHLLSHGLRSTPPTLLMGYGTLYLFYLD